ncbi:hypothetical protein ES288_D09G127800v1 [Gossypium darwinii]|uniref:Uncharacterized protein n=1 Tax=Gossypium darwinii TaxID=34276 RepID=A0A5D2BBJ3_GOSDA|nr:hypothetical protein ES288_D09G127800v1 [Gossypium darwinii]
MNKKRKLASDTSLFIAQDVFKFYLSFPRKGSDHSFQKTLPTPPGTHISTCQHSWDPFKQDWIEWYRPHHTHSTTKSPISNLQTYEGGPKQTYLPFYPLSLRQG